MERRRFLKLLALLGLTKTVPVKAGEKEAVSKTTHYAVGDSLSGYRPPYLLDNETKN